MSRGIHIIADMKGLDFWNFLMNIEIMEELLLTLAEKHNLSVIWKMFHSFGKVNEFSCVLMLAESHISMHTWPEKDLITVDVFVCGVLHDNRWKAKNFYEDLKSYLSPKSVEEQFLDRI